MLLVHARCLLRKSPLWILPFPQATFLYVPHAVKLLWKSAIDSLNAKWSIGQGVLNSSIGHLWEWIEQSLETCQLSYVGLLPCIDNYMVTSLIHTLSCQSFLSEMAMSGWGLSLNNVGGANQALAKGLDYQKQKRDTHHLSKSTWWLASSQCSQLTQQQNVGIFI